MRKGISMLLAVLFVIGTVGMSFAMEQGNKRKGKYIYRKVYKQCHGRGEVDTPKPALNPDAKTQAQWEQVFDNQEFGAFGCSEEWEALSEDDLKDIFAYLHAHAADSPTPAKCE